MQNYEIKSPALDYGVTVTMKVLGGKWKPCIIDCIANGINRPDQIHKEIKQANMRVINQQLKELYEYEVVSKTIFQEYPLKVEYALTYFGNTLPIISAMEQLGKQNAHKIYELAVRRNENITPPEIRLLKKTEYSVEYSKVRTPNNI